MQEDVGRKQAPQMLGEPGACKQSCCPLTHSLVPSQPSFGIFPHTQPALSDRSFWKG